MIRVARMPPPADFKESVQRPGRGFLARCPQPTESQWKAHSYWRRALRALHSAYAGICAYSCHWIPYVVGTHTIDHFKPKRRHPGDAYEWENYRLACQLMNARKRDHEDILDPFRIQSGWFIIEFPALIVKPAPSLSKAIHARVKNTRDILGLNDEDSCMPMRLEFVTSYCREEITFAHLERHAPFLALQMKEQGYDRLATIQKTMNIYPPSK